MTGWEDLQRAWGRVLPKCCLLISYYGDKPRSYKGTHEHWASDFCLCFHFIDFSNIHQFSLPTPLPLISLLPHSLFSPFLLLSLLLSPSFSQSLHPISFILSLLPFSLNLSIDLLLCNKFLSPYMEGTKLGWVGNRKRSVLSNLIPGSAHDVEELLWRKKAFVCSCICIETIMVSVAITGAARSMIEDRLLKSAINTSRRRYFVVNSCLRQCRVGLLKCNVGISLQPTILCKYFINTKANYDT